jgi:hypothetical protein
MRPQTHNRVWGRFVLIWLRIQGWRSKVKSFSSRSVGREDDWRLLESWDATSEYGRGSVFRAVSHLLGLSVRTVGPQLASNQGNRRWLAEVTL